MEQEGFLKHINEFMIGRGFSFNDDMYSKRFQFQQQGTTMFINGQQMVTPGQIVNVEYIVHMLGQGFVDDEPFEMIWFMVKQNNETTLEYNQSFYYDDLREFESICNKIFK